MDFRATVCPWDSPGRKWQPTPVFLPGEFHGQRSLVGCSPGDPPRAPPSSHPCRPGRVGPAPRSGLGGTPLSVSLPAGTPCPPPPPPKPRGARNACHSCPPRLLRSLTRRLHLRLVLPKVGWGGGLPELKAQRTAGERLSPLPAPGGDHQFLPPRPEGRDGP